MFVYVTKFSKYPELIKIGVSTDVKARTITLEKTHGKAINCDSYIVGNDYIKLETALHRHFKEHSAKNLVKGDGASEFFHDVIFKEVTDILLSSEFDSIEIPREINLLETKLKTLLEAQEQETIRCNKLIGRLLGYKGNAYYSVVYRGFFDCARVSGAILIGFPSSEVFIKESEYQITQSRFTTPKRVEAAYKLSGEFGFITNNKLLSMKNEIEIVKNSLKELASSFYIP